MPALIRLFLVVATSVAVAGPATAATNLIANGSFEQGFAGWTIVNPAAGSPVVVIEYGQRGRYPLGAYGEPVPLANSASASPDAVGNYVAYFSDDGAGNESLRQLTQLAVGRYELGFSVYLPANGYRNPSEATFSATIVGTEVARFTASAAPATQWLTLSGVAEITEAGWYETAFTFDTPGSGAAKDFVIDRVYAVRTQAAATVEITAGPTLALPEPSTWALMIAGFGLIGAARRRAPSLLA